MSNMHNICTKCVKHLRMTKGERQYPMKCWRWKMGKSANVFQETWMFRCPRETQFTLCGRILFSIPFYGRNDVCSSKIAIVTLNGCFHLLIVKIKKAAKNMESIIVIQSVSFRAFVPICHTFSIMMNIYAFLHIKPQKRKENSSISVWHISNTLIYSQQAHKQFLQTTTKKVRLA